MKRFFAKLLNLLFFLFVIGVAVAIALFGFGKKVDDQQVKGVVAKKNVRIAATANKTIQKVHVQTGEPVEKGDLLVEFQGDGTRSSKDENIYAPVDGTVAEISATDGSIITTSSPIITLFSDENVSLVAEMTYDQYELLQELPEVTAYNQRIDRQFVIEETWLSPEAKSREGEKEKKIEVIFSFIDQSNAARLLHNEDIQVYLRPIDTGDGPVSSIVRLWDDFLARTGI